MQIKLRRASLAGPSDRSSAATRLIANIFQGTDLVHRHCDSLLERPTSRPGDSARLPSPTPFGPHPRSSRHSIHIGHALAAVLSNPFLAQRRGDDPSNAFQAPHAATLT